MRKVLVITAVLLCQLSFSALAQDGIVAKIAEASSSVKTLSCNFEQTKRMKLLKSPMKASGRMCYEGGDKLRWEYSSPYHYIFLLNNGKVTLSGQSGTSVIDAAGSKLFSQITRIMASSVTGECLSDKQNFELNTSFSGNSPVASLKPLKKELRQMFETIRLTFNPVTLLPEKIELLESGGDSTTIELKNVIINERLDPKEFGAE